jgi:hypothetical protein
VDDWGFIPDFTDNGQHNAPVLKFYENFVVSFVETLSTQIPGLKSQIRAVVGGSLGGNLGMNFGRRTDLKWLPAVIAWSPGSIWNSLAGASFVSFIPLSSVHPSHPSPLFSPHEPSDGWDILKHQAPRQTWFLAGGDPQNIPEQATTRADWFSSVFDKDTSPVDPPNPYMWYRADWPCIESAIVADRLDRFEYYNATFRYIFSLLPTTSHRLLPPTIWLRPSICTCLALSCLPFPNLILHLSLPLPFLPFPIYLFRLWHFRLACEQLVYSQQAPDPYTGQPLYLNNTIPMLFACGKADAFAFADICPSTETVSGKMVNTPGRAMFLVDTGHSIHNERPVFWGEKWVEFIDDMKGREGTVGRY